VLSARCLPRATPTIMPTIQPAENSHTTIVAIHHHIINTSLCFDSYRVEL
jgi:hypothetical protein